MAKTLHYELSPCWNTFESIFHDIESIIKDTNDLLPAIKMVSTELLENAIKYGEFGDGSSINYYLTNNEFIQISVSNRVKNKVHLDILKSQIEKIQKSNDVGELYKSRLQELMEGVSFGESMLGLLRIAYEGEFSLEYDYINDLLTVIAKRKI